MISNVDESFEQVVVSTMTSSMLWASSSFIIFVIFIVDNFENLTHSKGVNNRSGVIVKETIDQVFLFVKQKEPNLI